MPIIFLPSMEPNSRSLFQNSSKIIRHSVYSFLQNYQYFSSTPPLLALPFSIAILLSHFFLVSSFSSSSLFLTIFYRLHNLFQAAGFPSSSEFFTVLNLKLSQTITSSIFTLPFTFTFFILAKSSVIQALNRVQKPSSSPSFSSIFSIFNPLLLTYICNSFFIISANATAFSFLFISFNCLESFILSSPNISLICSVSGAIAYSIIVANAFVTSNLALVLSGAERSGGLLPFLKACVMIRGRTSAALSLALPVNLGLAGIEALFQYRIVRAYHHKGQTLNSLMVLEGLLIGYMYSVLIVVDTIASFIFFKSITQDQEGLCAYNKIEIAEENNSNEDYEHVSLKVCQEFA